MTGRAEKKVRAKPKTRSARAGLTFPVVQVHKMLREGNYARRISRDASVCLTAALEYLCTEILRKAVKAVEATNGSRITPRHIMMAIKNDEEINRMLKDVIISRGGVIPNIHSALL